VRTAIFWAHLATGACVGVVVLVMSVTGALLSFQPQIQAWADTRGLDGGPPGPGTPLLPPDELMARVAVVHSGIPTTLRVQRGTDVPVELEYGRDSRLFVNAYSGEVLGTGSAGTRAFFTAITGVHRWLGLGGAARPRGRAVTGAANLALLFMVCSGVFLWWPRNITRRAFRAVLLFRRGLRPKARDFNWHNVIGIWSCVPLAIIAVSAVVISYGWAGGLVDRAAGDGAARTVAAPVVDAAGAAGGAAGALARARLLRPDWRTITLQLPARGGTYALVVAAGAVGQPHRQARLRVDAATGAVAAWEPFEGDAAAQRLRRILRYAHTGEVLGVAGQAIAGLVSAGAALLVWTGLSLALRRLSSWRKR
jgi:uncharacterized iron-regulated membrane protein